MRSERDLGVRWYVLLAKVEGDNSVDRQGVEDPGVARAQGASHREVSIEQKRKIDVLPHLCGLGAVGAIRWLTAQRVRHHIALVLEPKDLVARKAHYHRSLRLVHVESHGRDKVTQLAHEPMLTDLRRAVRK